MGEGWSLLTMKQKGKTNVGLISGRRFYNRNMADHPGQEVCKWEDV